MKKLLAILLVVATLFCIAACDNGDTDTTTTTVAQDSTTTTTTKQDDTTTTTTVGGSDTTTTTVDETTTATTIENTTTTTKKEETTVDNGPKPINGVDPTDPNNQKKVVNGVYTSENGGIQLAVPGFQTYTVPPISMVLQGFPGGQIGTNAICVAVYPKGTDSYDSADVFENKTQADFESVLQQPIESFEKIKLQGYTCYKAVTTPGAAYQDANGNPRSFYRVWVFQTENAKYFINFMQAPDVFQSKDWSNPDMAPVAAQVMNSIVIFD